MLQSPEPERDTMIFEESLIPLAAIFLLACCSPGPVFLLIASTAAEQGRAAGLRLAMGVACASFIWSSITILGLGAILASLVWAQAAIRLFAAAYLIWLGFTMIRSSLKKPILPATPAPGRKSAFLRGLLASLTNPKALAFFGSAFALTAPSLPNPGYHLSAVVMLTMLSALWHGALALIFATALMQRGYRAMKRRIDLLVGGIFILMGGGLLTSTRFGR